MRCTRYVNAQRHGDYCRFESDVIFEQHSFLEAIFYLILVSMMLDSEELLVHNKITVILLTVCSYNNALIYYQPNNIKIIDIMYCLYHGDIYWILVRLITSHQLYFLSILFSSGTLIFLTLLVQPQGWVNVTFIISNEGRSKVTLG